MGAAGGGGPEETSLLNTVQNFSPLCIVVTRHTRIGVHLLLLPFCFHKRLTKYGADYEWCDCVPSFTMSRRKCSLLSTSTPSPKAAKEKELVTQQTRLITFESACKKPFWSVLPSCSSSGKFVVHLVRTHFRRVTNEEHDFIPNGAICTLPGKEK